MFEQAPTNLRSRLVCVRFHCTMAGTARPTCVLGEMHGQTSLPKASGEQLWLGRSLALPVLRSIEW